MGGPKVVKLDEGRRSVCIGRGIRRFQRIHDYIIVAISLLFGRPDLNVPSRYPEPDLYHAFYL